MIDWFLEIVDTVTFGLLGRSQEQAVAARTAQEEAERKAKQNQREAMIGRVGIVETALRPSGKIRVDGEVHEAMADGTAIDAGTDVVITGVRTFAFTVRKT